MGRFRQSSRKTFAQHILLAKKATTLNDQKPLSFQQIILKLHDYWSDQGCAILQPYDMEMGAGTFHTATTLRFLVLIRGKPLMCSLAAVRQMAAMVRTPTGCSIITNIR
jgi:hypothetical protein